MRSLRKGLFFSLTFDIKLRKRVVFQSKKFNVFLEKGLLLSCPMPFRDRFYISLGHLGVDFDTRDYAMIHLGSNFEVLGPLDDLHGVPL